MNSCGSAYYPAEFEALRSEHLLTAQFGCLCAAANPRIGAVTTAGELAPLPSLEVSQFGRITRMIDHYFEAHGQKRQVGGVLTSYLAIADALSNSDLYAIVPAFLARQLCRHPGVRFAPIDDPRLSLPIHLCWHNNVHTHPFISLLRSMLAGAAREAAT